MTNSPPLRRLKPRVTEAPDVWAADGLECWDVKAQF